MSLKKKTLKKAISMVTALTTIVWLSGISMFAVSVNVASAAITDGALISSNATNSDGTPTLKSLDVYIVKLVGTKKFKRLILNPQVFNSYQHFNWNSVQEVDQSVVDGYKTSALVRVDGDLAEKVYGLAPQDDTGMKGWINLTNSQFVTEGGADPDSIYTINSTDAGNYTAVGDVSTVNQLTTFLSAGTLPSTTPVPSGDLTLSLAADSPSASTLVQGQASADLAHFKFASTAEAKVTKVILTRIGVSANSSLSNVYLFDGAQRLTDAAAVSSDNKVTFSNSNGIFTVNGVKTISVKSDIAGSTSGQTVGVQLTEVTASSGTVVGTPVSGNIHSIASATLAGASFGTITPSATSDVNPASGILMWQGTLTITTRSVQFSRMALRNLGTIQTADIKNFKLFVAGEEVSTVASLDSNGYVTFALSSPKTLTTGSAIFKVLADVIGGSTRTVQLSLQNKADIDLKDSSYGVNVTISSNVPADAGLLTIATGSMTVEKADLPASDVTASATDAVIGKFKLSASGEAIKIETLTAGFASSDSNIGSLRNARLMVDGEQVGSTAGSGAFIAAGLSFTALNFVVEPGTPKYVEVRADVFDDDGTNNVSNTDTITASLDVPASNNAKRQVSLGMFKVPDVVAVDSNPVTVGVGALTLAKNNTYASQSVVVPQTAFKLASYNMTAGSAEDVVVDTFSVDFTGSGTFTVTDLTNVYVKYGDKTSATKSTVTATSNTWSVSYTLAKGTSVPFEIYGNIGSSITATDAIYATTTVSGNTASSGQSASSGAITGQTITAASGSISGALAASSPVIANLNDNQTVAVADFKITSVNDSYTVTQVVLGIAGTPTTVSQVKLKDGASVLGTLPGASSVTFSGLSIPVAKDSSKVLSVELILGSVGVGAGTSGEAVTVTLTSFKHQNSAGTVATATPGTAANAQYVYKGLVVIENDTLPSAVLSAGTKTLAKFKVSSTSGDTIGWKKMVFTVTQSVISSAGPATSAFALWDVTGGGNTQVAGAFTASGTFTDGGTGGTQSFVATSEQEVNGTRTYELRATVGGTHATGAYITTNIATGVSSHTAPAAYSTVAATGATFVWSDQSAQSHSATTTDWNDDYQVKNLPTASQALTK